ncbi:uncharacterized protein TRIREDRAFT_76250 [Trichoderma reesei QM6a]|uniref:Predicted protein n=1 Tax=Hypocrea jecorina (strain QM6a) TaxID=431241 RepID=G0RF97_HYPJQ|nr:uncharacterized protein TRIREDRAFT_76250 [Trichoderma reesei QM6a]EGR50314.1 predicted protein [Trichoderma reesei QM6a]
MDDATILGQLPADQRDAAVTQAESKFWPAFLAQKDAQHADFIRAFEVPLTKAKVELGTLDGQREQLTKLRENLALQLNQVERELAQVVLDYDRKANETLMLEKRYEQAEQNWLQHREGHVEAMVSWFQDRRAGRMIAQDQTAQDQTAQDQTAQDQTAQDQTAQDQTAQDQTAQDQITQDQTGKVTAQDQAGTRDPVFLVNLVDADDQVIGPIYKTEPWNQWVKAILNMPIKRDVKVRRGRKFTTDHLTAIYDHTEAKGVKWLSCMIQAIGEIQGKRCLSCNKNQGAFDDCIIIGTPLFQKCGNCEWNRQGCHGAALVAEEEGSSAGPAQEKQVSKEVSSDGGADRIFKGRAAPSQEDGVSNGAVGADTSREPPQQTDPARPAAQERRGLPTSRPPVHRTEQLSTSWERSEQKAYPTIIGFTPANVPPSRPPSQDFETPTPRSLKSSPEATKSILPLPKITKDVLVLKHKDGVYTEPEIVAGVPLEKIDPSHPYWDPDWPNLEQSIEPLLAHCEDEYKVAMAKRGSKDDKATKRFQLGRQVNRGKEIIKFLEEGEISPFQLLSKKYTAYGKGSITSYDTLFRMCHALRELKHFKAKGKIDVEPLEWMRHRLHELWEELGSEFKPAEAIRGFYHDPKMAQLREECGMKNIGRPRGSKAHRRSDTTPADAHSAAKRKRSSFHSPSRNGEECDRSSMEFMSESGNNTTVLELRSPVPGGPITKRARSLSPSIRPYRVTVDDTTEFTDKDASSGTPLTQNDFRIDQIKSRLYTTPAGLTQYLHWIKEDRCLEHQTLQGDSPVTWRALSEPVNFDVRLVDLVEVLWNRRELKAHFAMTQRSMQISPHIGPRGDIMVSFNRERTLKRLIKVLEARGVRTIEGSREELQRRWTAMQSETLSQENYELSSRESRRPAALTAPPVVR